MSLVLPGQIITSEQGFTQGHGTFFSEVTEEKSTIVSALAGRVERINKFITVRSFKSRYLGEVGDLIVGRINSIESKRWKVDIFGHKDANLLLSSVNLPDGVQRMRTHEDQMQMRTLYTEGDLISAEIQTINNDGTISLHTRSLRYGKLENGQFVRVPATLVKRLPQHNLSTSWGVDLLLGRNGGIWITRTIPDEWSNSSMSNSSSGSRTMTSPSSGSTSTSQITDPEALQLLKLRQANTAILANERIKIARTRQSILLLSQEKVIISPDTINSIYQMSIQLNIAPKNILEDQYREELLTTVL